MTYIHIILPSAKKIKNTLVGKVFRQKVVMTLIENQQVKFETSFEKN